MNVYLFGNIDTETDNIPLIFAEQLQKQFSHIHFINVKPNEEVPFIGENLVYIVDTIAGLDELRIFDENQIGALSNLSRATVHDYDLGFQLKYLKKLGKINKVKILGVPMNKPIDYSSFQSIFKKFVAQDIQGS